MLFYIYTITDIVIVVLKIVIGQEIVTDFLNRKAQ